MATLHRKFFLGRILVTPGALAAMEAAGQTPHEFLHRHVRGDWGDVGAHDRQANEAALRHGARLLSVYWTRREVKLWVITEADRQSTTILLPEEY